MANSDASKAQLSRVVEDPSTQAIARVYAEAFLNAAGTDADSLLEEYGSFLDDVLQPNAEFESFIYSGAQRRADKIALINRVIGSAASAKFVNFLCVLISRGRIEILPVIFRESVILQETRQGKRRVTIKSATALSAAKLETIRARLAKSLPFEPILEPEVDATLLGGIVVQVGDTVYDSSLRNRMKQLRNNLQQRSLHEIQSGRDRFSHTK